MNPASRPCQVRSEPGLRSSCATAAAMSAAPVSLAILFPLTTPILPPAAKQGDRLRGESFTPARETQSVGGRCADGDPVSPGVESAGEPRAHLVPGAGDPRLL